MQFDCACLFAEKFRLTPSNLINSIESTTTQSQFRAKRSVTLTHKAEYTGNQQKLPSYFDVSKAPEIKSLRGLIMLQAIPLGQV